MSNWSRRLARVGSIAAAMTAVALSAAACGSSDDSSSTTGAAAAPETPAPASGGDKPFAGKTIGYVQAGSIPYYDTSVEGARMAVEQLGGELKVFNAAFDAQKELAGIQDAITQQVDGIILFPLSDASTRAELRLTDRAGIPMVVLYGYSDDIRDEGAGFVEVDYTPYGQALGEGFREIVPSGEWATVTGQLGRGEVEAFTDGFVDGSGSGDRLVERIAADWDRQRAFNATQDIITKHPDLRGLLVGNEDMAVGAVKALGSKIDDVAVVSQNGSPEGNDMLRAGTLKMTVGASPSQEAAMAVALLKMSINGEEPPQRLCNTPFALNTPEAARSVPWPADPKVIESALADPPCTNW
jgi:ribose transport system substrate-binding protein